MVDMEGSMGICLESRREGHWQQLPMFSHISIRGPLKYKPLELALHLIVDIGNPLLVQRLGLRLHCRGPRS